MTSQAAALVAGEAFDEPAGSAACSAALRGMEERLAEALRELGAAHEAVSHSTEDFAHLKAELAGGLAEVRDELVKVRSECQSEFADTAASKAASAVVDFAAQWRAELVSAVTAEVRIDLQSELVDSATSKAIFTTTDNLAEWRAELVGSAIAEATAAAASRLSEMRAELVRAAVEEASASVTCIVAELQAIISNVSPQMQAAEAAAAEAAVAAEAATAATTNLAEMQNELVLVTCAKAAAEVAGGLAELRGDLVKVAVTEATTLNRENFKELRTELSEATRQVEEASGRIKVAEAAAVEAAAAADASIVTAKKISEMQDEFIASVSTQAAAAAESSLTELRGELVRAAAAETSAAVAVDELAELRAELNEVRVAMEATIPSSLEKMQEDIVEVVAARAVAAAKAHIVELRNELEKFEATESATVSGFEKLREQLIEECIFAARKASSATAKSQEKHFRIIEQDFEEFRTLFMEYMHGSEERQRTFAGALASLFPSAGPQAAPFAAALSEVPQARTEVSAGDKFGAGSASVDIQEKGIIRTQSSEEVKARRQQTSVAAGLLGRLGQSSPLPLKPQRIARTHLCEARDPFAKSKTAV